MRIQRWGLLVAAAGLVLGSCSGGSGDAVDVEAVPVASGLTVTADAFTFANFPSGTITEEFNTDDLVEMFGSGPDVCRGGSTPCVATPEAAAFARMVNQARTSGHCEGLVVLAASRFIRKVEPKTSALGKDVEVLHAILRAFATQFIPETQDEADGFSRKSLKEIVGALAASFARGTPEYSLGVYTSTGGHALLPYALEFPNKDTAVIKVYDSNWPGADRYVTVDLSRGEWSFSFSGKDPANDPKMWRGKKGDIDLISLKTRESGSCPFCAIDKALKSTTFLIRSVDTEWSIETDDGVVSPQDAVAGATTVRPLRSPGVEQQQGRPVDYIVTVPASNKKVTVKAPKESKIFAMTPKAMVEVSLPQGAAGDVLFTEGSAIVNESSATVTVAAGDNAGTASGEGASVEVTPDGVAVSVVGADGKPVTTTTNESAPVVEVVGAGAPTLPAGTNYVQRSDDGAGTVKEKTVGTDGSVTETETKGGLPSTSTSVSLSKGLSTSTGSTDGGASSSGSATGQTTNTTSSAGGGSTDNGQSGAQPGTGGGTQQATNTTRAPATTVAPASRTTVNVTFNLDEWSLGLSDLGSSGFTATSNKGGSCGDVGCLEGLSIEFDGGGTDASGSTKAVPFTFTMSSVAIPFSLRCGDSGSWVQSQGSGSSHKAACTISNVTNDDVVYLRA